MPSLYNNNNNNRYVKDRIASSPYSNHKSVSAILAPVPIYINTAYIIYIHTHTHRGVAVV